MRNPSTTKHFWMFQTIFSGLKKYDKWNFLSKMCKIDYWILIAQLVPVEVSKLKNMHIRCGHGKNDWGTVDTRDRLWDHCRHTVRTGFPIWFYITQRNDIVQRKKSIWELAIPVKKWQQPNQMKAPCDKR